MAGGAAPRQTGSHFLSLRREGVTKSKEGYIPKVRASTVCEYRAVDVLALGVSSVSRRACHRLAPMQHNSTTYSSVVSGGIHVSRSTLGARCSSDRRSEGATSGTDVLPSGSGVRGLAGASFCGSVGLSCANGAGIVWMEVEAV